MLTLFDPCTGDQRGTCSNSDDSDVEAAVHTARTAVPGWATLTPGQRATGLLQLANVMLDNIPAYVDAEQAGTGKPDREVIQEVTSAPELLTFFAGAVRSGSAPAGGTLIPRHESWVRWEPLGVVGAIVPWNYPLLMALWRVAPALAAGNTVVLKPSETTPDTAMLLAKDAKEILGPGVLVTLPGDRTTGRLLVYSNVDMIAFTGSADAGREISTHAELRPTSLELGGNCPVIVLPDAPKRTCSDLLDAVTYNAGQSCAAPARVITLDSNYQDVLAGLKDGLSARRAGIEFGPLNNALQAARFDQFVGCASASYYATGPVEVLTAQSRGYWRPVTILADIDPHDPAVTREVFGPALTVQSAPGISEAIALANSVPQALAASVWSQNLNAALRVAGSIRAGEVWLNCHLVQTPELPHSGRGQSGNGVDLSALALGAYQRPKTITAYVD